MWWDVEESELYMTVTVPTNTWFAIGFGSQMVDTDMIVWHADAEEPYSEDYKSFSKGKPTVDQVNNVQTSH
jgi:hypothetical protein